MYKYAQPNYEVSNHVQTLMEKHKEKYYKQISNIEKEVANNVLDVFYKEDIEYVTYPRYTGNMDSNDAVELSELRDKETQEVYVYIQKKGTFGLGCDYAVAYNRNYFSHLPDINLF